MLESLVKTGDEEKKEITALKKEKTSGNETISIREVDIHYDDNHAIKDVSMDINPKEITAFIGPSGCGKSTLLRAINRMNDEIPSCRMEGEINWRGYDILSEEVDPVILREKIGMVFQKPNPFPKSIYENIAYGPKIHGVTNKEKLDDIVEESLKDAALWDEVKDRLQENAMDLSGGQQQRLCLARALAIEPEVILLDEPCSALDPIATAKIEDLLEELKKDYTVVIVTHNMQQAARISDFTAYLYLGELIEVGETTRIFEKPEKELTEKYITGRFG